MSILPELSFDWSQPCGELPEDSMGRANHARNLTQFLIQKGQETSYVLNLNAKWGTGKTYFLRRWVAEIEQIYPTVYIDAWSSDHSGDPLLSVVSGIKSKLHELSDVSGYEAKLFDGVAKAVKAAAPAVVRALIKGQLKRAGINIDDLGDAFSNDDAADAGAKLVEQAINAHEEASVGVDNIKASIQGWLESVVRKEKRQYPLFVFIDELDRCRPTYAIEMLETIKHIFDMKNVVFVVATDKDQLQHSIRAIYGAEFDSRLYLDRFFTRTVTLSNPSRADFIARKLIDSDTFSTFAAQGENFVYMASDEGREADLRKLLTGIADGFNWPLRTVSLWLDRLEAALIISHRKLDIILLSFMMALETDNSDWLRKYQDNVPIFRNGPHDGAETLKFKSFIITTRWSFIQHKEYLIKIGFPNMPHIMESEHDAQVDLLDFVLNRLHLSVNSDSDYYMSIRSAFKKAISGEGIDKHSFASDSNSPPYHSVALDFHSYFHEMSGTNIDHYYDICRYSSLLS